LIEEFKKNNQNTAEVTNNNYRIWKKWKDVDMTYKKDLEISIKRKENFGKTSETIVRPKKKGRGANATIPITVCGGPSGCEKSRLTEFLDT
jgi:hypothetical protein